MSALHFANEYNQKWHHNVPPIPKRTFLPWQTQHVKVPTLEEQLVPRAYLLLPNMGLSRKFTKLDQGHLLCTSCQTHISKTKDQEASCWKFHKEESSTSTIKAETFFFRHSISLILRLRNQGIGRHLLCSCIVALGLIYLPWFHGSTLKNFPVDQPVWFHSSRFGGSARVWYGDCWGGCVLHCIGSKRPSAIEQPWAWPAYQPSHVIGRQSPDWDEEKMENKNQKQKQVRSTKSLQSSYSPWGSKFSSYFWGGGWLMLSWRG